MLSFTNEVEKDASPLWQLYGIETASFALFLTQQLVILVPVMFISCMLILSSFLIKKISIVSWLGNFLFNFFTSAVVCNLPLRFLMEVMLDSLICAIAQIHDKATGR